MNKGALHSFGFGSADQAVSSVTNFLLVIMVAHLTTPSQFGGFALAYSAYVLAIGLEQALAGEVLLVVHGTDLTLPERLRRRTSAGLTLLLGAVIGVVMIGVGLAVSSPLRGALLVIGVALPGLLLQDLCRFVAFAEGRPSLAFWNDLLWGMLQIGGLLALNFTWGDTGIGVICAIWAGSGCVAAVVALVALRILPTLSGCSHFLRRHGRLSARYGVEYASTAGASQLVLMAVGAIGGLAAAGSLRAAQALFGPMNVATLAARLLGLPRMARSDRPQRKSYAVRISAVLTGLVLVWSAVVLLVPASLGAVLYGATWTDARPLLPAFAVQYVGLAIGMGGFLLVRAAGSEGRTLGRRLSFAVATLAAGCVGARYGGAGGAAWGLAFVGVGFAVLWWLPIRLKAATRPKEETTPPPVVSADPLGLSCEPTGHPHGAMRAMDVVSRGEPASLAATYGPEGGSARSHLGKGTGRRARKVALAGYAGALGGRARSACSSGLLPLLLVLAAASCTPLALALFDSVSLEMALAIGIGVAALGPLIVRWLMGSLDSREPIVPSMIAVTILYSIRGIVDISNGTEFWVRVDVSAAYTRALALTLVMVVAIQVGYHLVPRLQGRREPRDPEPRVFTASVVRRYAYGLGIIGNLGMAVSIVYSGGLSAYVLSRSQVQTGTNIPFLSMSLVFAFTGMYALLSIPAGSRTKFDVVSAFLIAFCPAVLTVLQGSRRYVLPVIVGLFLLYYLKRDRPIPWGRVAVGALAVTFIFLIPMERSRGNGYSENSRSYASALGMTLSDPAGAVSYIFESQSTAMTTTTALAVLDTEKLRLVPTGHGSYTMVETVLQPFPRQLMPGKPESLRNALIQARWGISAGHCVGLCPTYGPVSPMMADGGMPAVALGGLLLGLLMHWWYSFCRRRRTNLAKAAYAGTYLSFALLWWSSLSELTVAMLAVGIPLIWIDYRSQRKNAEGLAESANRHTALRSSVGAAEFMNPREKSSPDRQAGLVPTQDSRADVPACRGRMGTHPGREPAVVPSRGFTTVPGHGSEAG